MRNERSVPVYENCIRERAHSEIRVRVMIQVHISSQRIAKHLNVVLFALQYLQGIFARSVSIYKVKLDYIYDSSTQSHGN